MNDGLVSQGTRTSIAKRPYIFVIFHGGPNSLPAPFGSAHGNIKRICSLGQVKFSLFISVLIPKYVILVISTCFCVILVVFHLYLIFLPPLSLEMCKLFSLCIKSVLLFLLRYNFPINHRFVKNRVAINILSFVT